MELTTLLGAWAMFAAGMAATGVMVVLIALLTMDVGCRGGDAGRSREDPGECDGSCRGCDGSRPRRF